jgi:hypothetical protein
MGSGSKGGRGGIIYNEDSCSCWVGVGVCKGLGGKIAVRGTTALEVV